MLIGIDASRATPGQRTGTEAYAFYLIEALIPKAAGREHRLRLYFNQPPAPGLFPSGPGLEQVVIPWPRLWTHVRLAWELIRRSPDVFFTPAHVIPLTYRRPSVATIHDLGFHYFPAAHPWQQRAYLSWATKHNSRRGRRVITDSQATRDDLVKLKHVPAAKVRVVYPGIDPALRSIEDARRLAEVRRQYGLRDLYLLYLGTLQPRKNLARLINAFAALAEPRPQLVLAGKLGWLARPILEHIQALPTDVKDDIHLPGFVDDADKAALISGAALLLYPSLYEGFGFPVLEGQACGTPVLTANTSSLPEIAGEGAWLVDPLDTAAITAGIRRLLDDTSLRQRLVANGRKNAGRFTWAAAADRVLDVLEEAAF